MVYNERVMFYSSSEQKTTCGFTLIELLVVMAIIGTLASVVLMSIDQSRAKGRDGARKSQISEILKGVELFYTDDGLYPLDGTPGDSTTGAIFSSIGSGFVSGPYFSRLPDEGGTRYYYCSSGDRKSILIAIDTEFDRGGSNFCTITRGPGPDYGCNVWQAANAADACTSRF